MKVDKFMEALKSIFRNFLGLINTILESLGMNPIDVGGILDPAATDPAEPTEPELGD